jgi:plastocyanin
VILTLVALTVSTEAAIAMVVIHLIHQQVGNDVVHPVVSRRAVELTALTTIPSVLNGSGWWRCARRRRRRASSRPLRDRRAAARSTTHPAPVGAPDAARAAREQHAPMSRRPVRTGLAAALLSAALGASAEAAVVPVELTARHATVQVAPGVRMEAWTFNGSVPGPTIRVREGDVVQVTLRNAEPPRGPHGRPLWHSVDFHAAQLAPNVGFAGVAPGQQRTFSFVASRPGVFMYHCGTAPMIEHIGMGMYGAITVEPAAGRPPAHEVTLVQSELYGRVHRGRLHGSAAAMRERRPPGTSSSTAARCAT